MGKVTTEAQTFVILIISLLLMLYCDYHNVFPGACIVCAFFHLVMKCTSGEEAQVLYLSAAAMGVLRCNSLFPAVAYQALAVRQGALTGLYADSFKWIMGKMKEAMSNVEIPHHYPYFGANADGVLEAFKPWFNELKEHFAGAFTIDYGMSATFIRPPGVSICIQDWAQKPALEADIILSKAVQLIGTTKLAISMLVGVVAYAMVGPMGLMAALWVYTTTKMVGEGDVHEVRPEAKGVPVRDGTYKIEVKLFGLVISSGIGTGASGVLHVPYHVCYGKDLMINSAKMRAYYIDTQQDLVVYGGPPQFVRLVDGEEVLVNCESVESRTTYSVEYSVDKSTGDFSWASLSKPGESGSPIYVERDGEYFLLGLAGRYIMERDHQKTEFVVKPNLTQTEDAGYYQKVVTHPGSGKTRHVIPAKIAEFHDRRAPGKRILVTGPTRVVCYEIFMALRHNWDVGLNIKDHSTYRRPTARIQIMAHATAVKMLNRQDRLVSNLGAVIIDEAHFNDPATMVLRDMGKYLVNKNVYVCEMSATLDGEVDPGSNYDITEEETTWKEMENKLATNLENGKRCLVFVPSVQSKEATFIKKRFSEFNPVILSRETFDAAMPGVRDESRKLIISTEIAECGINVPELDCVFDTSVKFKYVLDAGVIQGSRVTIDKAAYIQRRGRVGRSKPGHYYYCSLPVENHLMDSATADYQVAMTGREWSSVKGNALGIHLTEKQFEKWLDSDQPITWIYLFLDTNGMPRSREELKKVISYWHTGNVERKDPTCKCSKCNGCFQWYDERLNQQIHKL